MWRTYSILCKCYQFFHSLIFSIYGNLESQVNRVQVYDELPIITGFSFQDLKELLFLWSEKNPPIEEQLYLFMKRFRTQPSEFYALDRDLRLRIYNREHELLKKEAEKMEELERKNKGIV